MQQKIQNLKGNGLKKRNKAEKAENGTCARQTAGRRRATLWGNTTPAQTST